MGHLIYGNTSTPIEIGDEMIAHVRTVIVTKLRRNESFPLTIEASSGVAETLWIHASIPLRFVMHDDDHTLDRALLVSMMNAANSARGLDLTSDEFSAALQNAHAPHALSA